MPRVRDELQHEATREQIKQIARGQMARGGTNSVSLRGIAREMGLTAPALYRYYPRMDDLITALILDAYNDQADALAAARDRTAGQSTVDRLTAVMMVYREWALEHRTDFQLIYGNPIPGYVAPAEITMPAARRGLEVFIDLIMDGVQAGDIAPPRDLIPPELVPHLEGVRAAEGYAIPLEALYTAIIGWPRMHGLVMLEVFDHIQPLVGNAEVFYKDQMHTLFRELGLKSS